MKKKTTVAKRGKGYGQLVTAISAINTRMVGRVATVANQSLVLRNWIVGAYIVEYEQCGADRAKYGTRLLPTLAADLAARGLKGLGAEVLRTCRLFFLSYPEISHAVRGKFELPGLDPAISQAVHGELLIEEGSDDSASTARSGSAIRQTAPSELPTPLGPAQLARISWAHFLELIRMDDPWKRAFYENEIIKGHWSQRQLQRQIGSLLYERTGLSTNKRAVIERARKQERLETVEDMLRDPYILEFAGLAERPEYSEDEMETALLDHLQRFLLELGRGFCFEARQFRMTEGRKHHRVDGRIRDSVPFLLETGRPRPALGRQ